MIELKDGENGTLAILSGDVAQFEIDENCEAGIWGLSVLKSFKAQEDIFFECEGLQYFSNLGIDLPISKLLSATSSATLECIACIGLSSFANSLPLLVGSPSLKVLKLISVDLTPTTQAWISGLPYLERLDLSQSPVCAGTITSLKSKESLSSVDISYTKLESIPNVTNGFRRLEYLNLTGNPLNDNCIPGLLSAFPSLLRLDISKTGFTFEGVKHIRSKFEFSKGFGTDFKELSVGFDGWL